MMEEAGSSNPLLQKTREINHLLQDAEVVGYDDIATVLKNVLTANVYITSQKGKVLGYAFVDDFECSLMLDKVINRGEFPRHYVKWLLRIGETRHVRLRGQYTVHFPWQEYDDCADLRARRAHRHTDCGKVQR